MYGIRARSGGDAAVSDQGVSLIELLAVIAILGILSTVAIPYFTGQQRRAHNAAVQQDLLNMRNAVEAASVAHAGDYVSVGLPVNTVIVGGEQINGMGAIGRSDGAGGGRVLTAVGGSESFEFRPSAGVSIWIETLTATSYCINGTHQGITTFWHVSTEEAGVTRGGCSSATALPSESRSNGSGDGSGSGAGGSGGGQGATQTCEPDDTECTELAGRIADDIRAAVGAGSGSNSAARRALAEKYDCALDDDACMREATNREQDAVIAEADQSCTLSAEVCRRASAEARRSVQAELSGA
jgi:prepilin-type N-terminal cleavage/methylation domain-containing protein